MKKDLLSFLFLLLASTNGLAQDSVSNKKQHKKIPAIYFSLNTGKANGKFIFGWEGTIIIKNEWGINYGVKASIHEAKLLPNDFEPGFTLFDGDGIPRDEIYFYTLSASKDYTIKQNKIIPGFAMGIAYLEHNTFSNFIYLGESNGIFPSSNYRYTHELKHAFGLLLKPKAKFLISKKIGLEVSLWTILNKIENYYGFEVSLLIGRLR